MQERHRQQKSLKEVDKERERERQRERGVQMKYFLSTILLLDFFISPSFSDQKSFDRFLSPAPAKYWADRQSRAGQAIGKVCRHKYAYVSSLTLTYSPRQTRFLRSKRMTCVPPHPPCSVCVCVCVCVCMLDNVHLPLAMSGGNCGLGQFNEVCSLVI